MNDKSLVSIVISCYNSGEYIDECLESIFNQTYKNFEILIVDDGSKDDTLQKINKFKNKKNYYSFLILKEFSKILNINRKSLRAFKIHGWKYSYNKTKLKQKFYWSKKFRLGICGDWFIGPNAEAGWKSALALYDEIKKTRQV